MEFAACCNHLELLLLAASEIWCDWELINMQAIKYPFGIILFACAKVFSFELEAGGLVARATALCNEIIA